MSQLILDNGSSKIKLGFQSTNFPFVKYDNCLTRISEENICGNFGEIFQNNKKHYPVQRGTIQSFREQFQIFDSLLVDTTSIYIGPGMLGLADSSLYFIGSQDQNLSDMKLILEYFLEQKEIGKLAFGIDTINALYSTGLITGLSIDLGSSYFRSMSVLNGWSIDGYRNSINFGGVDIDRALEGLIGSVQFGQLKYEQIKNIKKQISFQSKDDQQQEWI